MKIHYLQHVEFEDLGCIEEWIKVNNHSSTATKFYEKFTLPTTDDFDFLIVLGGSMNIYEEQEYPWLKAEKEFIKKVIDLNKKVIGICLGAQLIADVLGTKIFSNNEKEIGWFSVQKSTKQTNLLFNIPNNFKTFHWHGDTFELPLNAKHIFTSKACKNQGFLFGTNVLGIQFHLEITEKSIYSMVENGLEELVSSKFVQTKEMIFADTNFIMENNQKMFQLLNNFVHL